MTSPTSTEPHLQPRPPGGFANLSWTWIGLVVALAAGPLIVGLFTLFRIPWTASSILGRELLIFGSAWMLGWIIRRKERLGWDSVGLQRPRFGQTALWVLITIPAVALALVLSVGIMKVLDLPFGSADAKKFEQLPLWVLAVVVLRAGFVEEFFYRGYAIDRLQRLTGKRWFAVLFPLLLFGVVHYRQGWAGIIIATLTGAVMTAVFLYKRNLWIGIIVHFLVDFIPNILMPLFSKGH